MFKFKGWYKLVTIFVVLALSIHNKKIHKIVSSSAISTDDAALFLMPPQSPVVAGQTIRRWGCHRTETPFIFVHIGKAGGGSIRIKIAAAAQNYTRGKSWKKVRGDQHYYPVLDKDTGRVRHAKFCNSAYNNFRSPKQNNGTLPKTFEKTKPCNAVTPIGHAIGCPGRPTEVCVGCDNANAAACDIVYVGHNMLGNEMHWLPPRYLQRWWHHHWYTNSSQSSEIINQGFRSMIPKGSPQWCPEYNKSLPGDLFSSKSLESPASPMLMECSNLASRRADKEVKKHWALLAKSNNYSPLYASLPLHRAVMLREPFSWLKSKFYWHHEHRKFTCDDIKSASHKSWGWAHNYIKLYATYLCGDDCVTRHARNEMTIEEVFRQAESNLRNSFSVVGILNETESFYEMIDTRISYMNMSHTPPPGLENRHASGKGGNITEYNRCSRAFDDVSFRRRFKEELPILASLERLFHVGVEVNRFQREELSQCREQTGAQ